MRGNKLKQAPPFSKTIYTISSVQGGLNNVPKYRLQQKGNEWFLHHRLQKVADGIALPPPSSIVKKLPDYERYDISSNAEEHIGRIIWVDCQRQIELHIGKVRAALPEKWNHLTDGCVRARGMPARQPARQPAAHCGQN